MRRVTVLASMVLMGAPGRHAGTLFADQGLMALAVRSMCRASWLLPIDVFSDLGRGPLTSRRRRQLLQLGHLAIVRRHRRSTVAQPRHNLFLAGARLCKCNTRSMP